MALVYVIAEHVMQLRGHTAIDSVIGATGILIGRIIRRNTAITAALPSQHGEETECVIDSHDGQRTTAATA